MFRVGDKVVCFLDSRFGTFDLDMDKIYTVSSCVNYDNSTQSINIGTKYSYSAFRFKKLSDYRKEKLNKICSKLEIE